MRTTFILTLLAAFAAQLALAIPPACLLSAVNTQDNPANLSAICGSDAKQVQQFMAANCGSNADTAQKAFIATCSSAGTSVAAYTATANSSSTSATRSSSGSSSATGTGTITTTARSSGSASGSAGSTQSTAGANADYRHNLKPMAAAAVALVGAVAAL